MPNIGQILPSGAHRGWRGPLYARLGKLPAGAIRPAYELQPCMLKHITDGTSKTMLVGEYTNIDNRPRGSFWAYTYASYALSQPVAQPRSLYGRVRQVQCTWREWHPYLSALQYRPARLQACLVGHASRRHEYRQLRWLGRLCVLRHRLVRLSPRWEASPAAIAKPIPASVQAAVVAANRCAIRLAAFPSVLNLPDRSGSDSMYVKRSFRSMLPGVASLLHRLRQQPGSRGHNYTRRPAHVRRPGAVRSTRVERARE